jgi:hypothetical protein
VDRHGRESPPCGRSYSVGVLREPLLEMWRLVPYLAQGTAIEVTPIPRVRDPTYPYPVNHLPALADLVACFAEGRPHQMELDGEGNFQMSNFSNDVRCIYHILASRVLPVISHTMITIERASCLYALLTEAPIDYGSLVTSTMMSV